MGVRGNEVSIFILEMREGDCWRSKEEGEGTDLMYVLKKWK
jgi:hypothetical protein